MFDFSDSLPLAQENILRLLKDRQVGYGDDFDFYKNKMINIIIPDHMQELNLDMNPAQYRHFDYEKAKKEFQEINAEYFKAIYFSLAPLLCVPMYQQIRPLEAIYGRGTLKRSSFWEDESLANFWGEDRFKHPSCVTDSILKTEKREVGNGDSVITSMPMVTVECNDLHMSAYGVAMEDHIKCPFIGMNT